MNNDIKIVVWSANGLTNHGPEVCNFLGKNNIDIMLVSETHFTNRSYIRIPGYAIYDTKHPSGNAHGGTAVIIKKSIKHYEKKEYKTEAIQSTTICIKDSLGSLLISAIYCPPRHTIKEENFKEYFGTLGNRFLAGGDYNAKHNRWGSRLTTPKGRELVKYLNNNNMKILSTGKPTYWPSDQNKIPDVIAFCVLKGIPINLLKAEQNLDLSSDHSPIIVSLSVKIINTQTPTTLTNKKTDWELF